jgi:signal transduction histidine kinase/ligand-binding sensor domain-containing protein/DNA-binding response OmpR family regulator
LRKEVQQQFAIYLNLQMIDRKYLSFLAFAICISFLLLSGQTSGQEIKFSVLTTKDGLSSNSVNAILKDRYGLLWFATDEGLNKFNGIDFTVYNHEQTNPSSLQSNEISALHEDKAGRLWVGTIGGGLHLYDRQKDKFKLFKSDNSVNAFTHNNIKAICSDYLGDIWVGTLQGLNVMNPVTSKITKFLTSPSVPAAISNDVITCIFEDKQKRMWIGTRCGLFRYDRSAKRFITYIHQPLIPSSLIGNTIKVIAQDRLSRLWVGTTQGLSMLLPSGNTFRNFCYDSNNAETISNNLVYSVAPENEKNIWLGTESGLDLMNTETGKVIRYKPDGRNSFGLSRKSIQCILNDPQGIMWLGTNKGGVNKYDKNLTVFSLKRSNQYDPWGLSAPLVTSFAEDINGDIFVGTDGGGLNLFHRKTSLVSHFKIVSKNNVTSSGLAILAIIRARNGNVWIGTYQDGLFCLDPKTGNYQQFKDGTGPGSLNNTDIFCIKEDLKGQIWVGTNGGGVNVYNPQSHTFLKYLPSSQSPNQLRFPLNGYIRAIEQDSKGNMWIASQGSGIAVFNPKTRTFKHFSKATSNLPSDKITSFMQDRIGRMWIGTMGQGLALYNPKDGTIVSFTQKDGLPGGVINKILEDNKGRIWFSTNKTISFLDPASRKVTNYTSYNGLQNSGFVQASGIKTSDGSLFFGGTEGFNFIDPDNINRNKNIPKIMFTDLKVGNNTITSSDTGILDSHISVAKCIQLNYKQNFSISYVALNYTSPKQNMYVYRLKGYERDWNVAGTNTTASYTNLSPGEYIFEVKGINNDGVWNPKEASIKIVVKPPFWMTVYAYLFYVLALAGSILFIRHRGIKKLHKQFAIEQEKREAERLHELDRLKIKFLTNLSHDFRTPISLIMAPTEKLLSQQNAEGVSSQLMMIKRNTRRLLNLVNQLLDFRKMEEKELKLNLEAGDIVAFVSDVCESFSDLSERKKVSFKFSSNVKILFTLFDADKIERVLFNLISNAFKFTSEGGQILVLLDADIQPGIDSNLSISVADNGIGIPPDKKEQVFERFFQNQSSAAILNQGSGIGLSIAKEFVQMHGGEISVESVVNVGSTFKITLPLTLSQDSHNDLVIDESSMIDDHVKRAHLETAQQQEINFPLVLIVEDNDDFRFYLKDNLKSNYRIVEAVNGKEGWQKALASHPDLIVSDISMPFMDGIELSHKIKGDKRTGHIPVILLTASTGEEEQMKGLTSGANDYLTKPFSFEILNAKIKNLLSYKSALKNTYSRQLNMTAAPVEVESGNEKFLKNVMLYIEDNLTNTQLSVEDLSKHVGMSRGSLYTKVLELTGQKPVEFIRSVKLERAAGLLEKSDMNVAQIAYAAGFATPNYFAKSFKAKYNMLPSEYMNAKRKSWEVKI